MYVSSTDIKCKSYTREMGLRVPSKVKVSLRMAGRLACFMDTWKVLTKDTWVLDAIQEYQIPLVGGSSKTLNMNNRTAE